MKTIYTGKKAFFLVVISVAIVLTIVYGTQWIYRAVTEYFAQDDRYKIIAIAQRNRGEEKVPTIYLEEILGLSSNTPTNLYAFTIREATKKLQEIGIFKDVHVARLRPGVISVSYTLRKPIAIMGDFENRAIDVDGRLFPIKPFFTDKKLPEIVLGSYDFERLKFAMSILDATKSTLSSKYEIVRIDVREVYGRSANKEIVLIVLDTARQGQILIRLDYHKPEVGLKRFLAMETLLNSDKKDSSCQVVDLRIPQIALIKR
jgi:cell division septal protein FtsQ